MKSKLQPEFTPPPKKVFFKITNNAFSFPLTVSSYKLVIQCIEYSDKTFVVNLNTLLKNLYWIELTVGTVEGETIGWCNLIPTFGALLESMRKEINGGAVCRIKGL